MTSHPVKRTREADIVAPLRASIEAPPIGENLPHESAIVKKCGGRGKA